MQNIVNQSLVNDFLSRMCHDITNTLASAIYSKDKNEFIWHTVYQIRLFQSIMLDNGIQKDAMEHFMKKYKITINGRENINEDVNEINRKVIIFILLCKQQCDIDASSNCLKIYKLNKHFCVSPILEWIKSKQQFEVEFREYILFSFTV